MFVMNDDPTPVTPHLCSIRANKISRYPAQHLIGTGQRSALKESLAWLEYAALQLSDTKLK